jgi:hypothetical protein
MQDLERKKYACGRYERLDRGEKIMKQRTYKATDAGHSALERTREFFI